MKKNKHPMWKRLPFIIIGALIFTFGLEIFLIPNGMVDGGVVGVSIMLSHLTGINFSIFLIVLNLPFFYLGYKQIGKTFCISTVIAIVVISIASSQMHLYHIKPFTDDILLTAIFGGALMGIGVGIVMRAGGTTDGVEISALIASNKTPFSVGQLIMFINLFILLASGFIFGWDKALYSIVAYFIAFKLIDVVVEGLDQSRSVKIISTQYKDIGDAIQARLGRSITYFKGQGGYSGEDQHTIYVVISRLEETKLKEIVEDFDENAFVTITHVNEVSGRSFKKKDIH